MRREKAKQTTTRTLARRTRTPRTTISGTNRVTGTAASAISTITWIRIRPRTAKVASRRASAVMTTTRSRTTAAGSSASRVASCSIVKTPATTSTGLHCASGKSRYTISCSRRICRSNAQRPDTFDNVSLELACGDMSDESTRQQHVRREVSEVPGLAQFVHMQMCAATQRDAAVDESQQALAVGRGGQAGRCAGEHEVVGHVHGSAGGGVRGDRGRSGDDDAARQGGDAVQQVVLRLKRHAVLHDVAGVCAVPKGRPASARN